MSAGTVNSQDEARALSVALLADEQEERLAANELAAKRRAARLAADAPGWTTQRAKLGVKLPPDIWQVRQPDGSYAPVGRSGKWHVLFGASGAAKTFLAAGFAAHDLRLPNGAVYWADFEDQADDLPDMFRAFGVHDLAGLHLFQPEAPPDAGELVAYCREHGITLVVMDAHAGAIPNAVPGDHGYSGTDVRRFEAELIRPLTKAGITVLTIDHANKSGALNGSHQKQAAGDVVFELAQVEPIHESAELGYSRVTVHKYRGGGIRVGETPAHLVYRNGVATIESACPVKPSLGEFVQQRQNGTVNRDLERAAAVVAWVAEHGHEVPTKARVIDGLMRSLPELFPAASTTDKAVKFAADTGRVVAKPTGRGRTLSYELPEPAERATTVDPSQLVHEDANPHG